MKEKEIKKEARQETKKEPTPSLMFVAGERSSLTREKPSSFREKMKRRIRERGEI